MPNLQVTYSQLIPSLPGMSHMDAHMLPESALKGMVIQADRHESRPSQPMFSFRKWRCGLSS
jgi:hypothetical protein